MSRAPVAPCPFCARHVRLSEAACPFCHAALPDAFRAQRSLASPAGRLHRAALHALRMSAVSVTAAACGGSVTVIGGNGGEADSAAVEDASGTGSSGGGSSGGGGTSSSSGGSDYDAPWGVAAYGGFIGPLYGGFVDAAYGGFIGPEDDASTGKDAGGDDAKPDHLNIAPPYGGVPGN